MKDNKNWKERFNKEFDEEYPSVRSYTAGHLQEWVINFIDQLISERDKELEILTSTIGYITAKYGEDNEVVKHFKGLLNK